MRKYQVLIAGQTVTVSLDHQHVLLPSGTGSDFAFQAVGEHLWLLTVGGNVFTVSEGQPTSSPKNDLQGTNVHFHLNARAYEAHVDDERSLLLRSLRSSHLPSGGAREVRAPMPGLISRVEVSDGETVKTGQGLLILEAMKMENEIRSSEDGKVKEILVKPGVAVEKGEILLILHPS